MHPYFDLVYRTAVFTINSLKEADERAREHDRQVGPGTTLLIKKLQATRLQKAITAVGMFSMFESILQDTLGVPDGFLEARRCLKVHKETVLRTRFDLFLAAVNVLKHGRGRSYQTLLQTPQLP